MTIEDLSERLRRGESSALAEIWDTFGDELRRRARTRLRQYGISGQTESMDICNAVLVDLAKKGTIELRQPGDLAHYVLRAIDNQVRDVFRELSRQRRDFRRVDNQPVENHPVTCEQTSPSIVLLRSEVLNRVREELGGESSKIVDLVVENYSWQEIGEAMNMGADAVRMRFTRALDRVRSQLLDASQDGMEQSTKN